MREIIALVILYFASQFIDLTAEKNDLPSAIGVIALLITLGFLSLSIAERLNKIKMGKWRRITPGIPTDMGDGDVRISKEVRDAISGGAQSSPPRQTPRHNPNQHANPHHVAAMPAQKPSNPQYSTSDADDFDLSVASSPSKNDNESEFEDVFDTKK